MATLENIQWGFNQIWELNLGLFSWKKKIGLCACVHEGRDDSSYSKEASETEVKGTFLKQIEWEISFVCFDKINRENVQCFQICIISGEKIIIFQPGYCIGENSKLKLILQVKKNMLLFMINEWR